MTKAEIQLVNVKKVFQMGEVKVPVLHNIHLDIYKGQITVILGASGSGKSTLLNLIGGVDRPTQGEIWFDEKDITTFNNSELTNYRKEHIGFVFQFYNLIPTLTAQENVEVSTEIISNTMESKEALDLVDLSDKINHFPSQMSGGQQQRVAIARAIAKKPRLMLCDEPTGALDLKTGQVILKLLEKLNSELKTTIVLITHAEQIAQMAHRIVRLGSGDISEIIENKNRLQAEEISW